jgi:recombination protein RecR
MLPRPARTLVRLLQRLPGVGERTATRYALYFLGAEEGFISALSDVLLDVKARVRSCARCGNLAEIDPASSDAPSCDICRDARRDAGLLCVVARVQDVDAIERSGAMRGLYFVLGRLVSPLDGVGPADLPLERLVARCREPGVREVILATPASVDGEATALLISRELASVGVTVSRIASGVPHGTDLELTDQVTLGRAIAGRRSG